MPKSGQKVVIRVISYTIALSWGGVRGVPGGIGQATICQSIFFGHSGLGFCTPSLFLFTLCVYNVCTCVMLVLRLLQGQQAQQQQQQAMAKIRIRTIVTIAKNVRRHKLPTLPPMQLQLGPPKHVAVVLTCIFS